MGGSGALRLGKRSTQPALMVKGGTIFVGERIILLEKINPLFLGGLVSETLEHFFPLLRILGERTFVIL